MVLNECESGEVIFKQDREYLNDKVTERVTPKVTENRSSRNKYSLR